MPVATCVICGMPFLKPPDAAGIRIVKVCPVCRSREKKAK